ncbi:MAG TPA: hypothetical protein VFU61_06875 [Steroidobacteraceae bacterium]|nr:hypothetical protein [Steroidobacteraceae bacterium]
MCLPEFLGSPAAIIAQHVDAAHAPCVADPIEEFEDLHGPLAAYAGCIPKMRRLERSERTAELSSQTGQFLNRTRVIEEIVHNLIRSTAADLLAQDRANDLFRFLHAGRKLPDPGRVVTAGREQRLQPLEQCPISIGESGYMSGKMQPKAASGQSPFVHELLDHDAP